MNMDDQKVAVLIEDLMSQFRVFGEGQEHLRREVSEMKNEVASIQTDLGDFRIETRLKFKESEDNQRQLKQMVQELATDQSKIKRQFQFAEEGQ